MSDETVINLGESDECEWDRRTEECHRFRLLQFKRYVLEAEDLHFHHIVPYSCWISN
jgi:hypothetical protein